MKPTNELSLAASRALLSATGKRDVPVAPVKAAKVKPPKPPTESQEQAALIAWFRGDAWQDLGLRDPRQLFSSQAGTMLGGGNDPRRFGRFNKLKKEGMINGVPDVMLAHPVAPFGGLFIELKRIKGGALRPDQREMLSLLARCGYAVTVAAGAEDAKARIIAYCLGRHQHQEKLLP